MTQVWRPALAARVVNAVGGLAFIGASIWVMVAAPTDLGNTLTIGAADLVGLVLIPLATFRWRMELADGVVSMVLLRTRRIDVRRIVGAKTLVGQGLTFVLENGRTESTLALGNSPRAHRKEEPTRSDLAARAVLVAAAEARGEPPPVHYRLPPTSGYKKAATRGLISGFIISWFLDD